MKATYDRKITQTKSQNITHRIRSMITGNYSKNKQSQKTQNVPFRKNRFFNILCRIRYQTQSQTGLTTPYQKRTKTVP